MQKSESKTTGFQKLNFWKATLNALTFNYLQTVKKNGRNGINIQFPKRPQQPACQLSLQKDEHESPLLHFQKREVMSSKVLSAFLRYRRWLVVGSRKLPRCRRYGPTLM